MKKVLIFLGIIVILFGGLAFLTNYSNKQASEGNPFGKSKLDPATVKQLDDPNYKNQILPDELEEKLNNKESLTVYFYSPTCSHCQVTSPVVVPMAEELDFDLPLFNLLEFEDGWRDYGIKSTPTIVKYENGEEVSRVEGNVGDEAFRKWFEEWSK
ncbi:thioredoxin family protein [Bacillus suaedaesalsae]|uniref:Thioredoxin family protein n=1 Tax=Bacillus suaedaesalsae TaxID=2810349 RepID=A0ABS2DF10_9BACI|nr:thioredoxin family protein [Bacillus suaedaesalsae]MBM6617050.1 thioredoxin family protein [Bacillus suaedaesalsae]